jgi:hypothetical protein
MHRPLTRGNQVSIAAVAFRGCRRRRRRERNYLNRGYRCQDRAGGARSTPAERSWHHGSTVPASTSFAQPFTVTTTAGKEVAPAAQSDWKQEHFDLRAADRTSTRGRRPTEAFAMITWSTSSSAHIGGRVGIGPNRHRTYWVYGGGSRKLRVVCDETTISSEKESRSSSSVQTSRRSNTSSLLSSQSGRPTPRESSSRRSFGMQRFGTGSRSRETVDSRLRFSRPPGPPRKW